jgi:hypothetical protein
MAETRKTRPVSWIKAALKDFEAFPTDAQSIFLTALTAAADGGKADIAKPMHGLSSGVFEIALGFRVHFGWFTPSKSRMRSGSFTLSRRNRSRASRRPSTKSIW